MSTKREVIEEVVGSVPGISFTELRERTGLANGVLQHHIHNSDKLRREKGAIVKHDTCNNCEFQGMCNETCLKKILRKPTKRKVLEMKKRNIPHNMIAGELGISDSTVSYHVSHLRELGLLK